MLAGLATSAAAVMLASIATAGMHGFWMWILRLRVFSLYATSSEAILRRTKYVDLNSFFTITAGAVASSIERLIAAPLTTSAAFLILALSLAGESSRTGRTRLPQRYGQRNLTCRRC